MCWAISSKPLAPHFLPRSPQFEEIDFWARRENCQAPPFSLVLFNSNQTHLPPPPPQKKNLSYFLSFLFFPSYFTPNQIHPKKNAS